jgi:hypothetical protein
MNDVVFGIIITAVVIVLFKWWYRCQEGLTSKPSDKEQEEIINQIVANPELFNKSFTALQGRYGWLDIITYEDIKSLIRKQALTRENLSKIFV